MVWLPDGEKILKIRLFLLTQFTNVIDTHTSGQTDGHRTTFDRVNHFTLFSKLIECNVPPCFINVIIDWYCKLESVVKWNSVFSKPYNVSCGVRQGGVLSPFLFNLYINDLLKDLLAKDYGCHVGSVFFGCFIYADDIIFCLLLCVVCKKCLMFAHGTAFLTT